MSGVRRVVIDAFVAMEELMLDWEFGVRAREKLLLVLMARELEEVAMRCERTKAV